MAKTPASLRQTRPAAGGLDPKLQALYENLEILNGARGKGLDKAVLVRDLLDLGLATAKKGVNGAVVPVKPGTGGDGSGDIGLVEPPTLPIGVLASGGFSTILVEWNKPTYEGHAYTEILRSDTDDFSKASLVSTTAANLYSDQVGTSKVVFYWVRFVNTLNIKGPVQSTNGVRGETQADIGEILDKLKGQIDESFLTPDFNSKLVDMENITKTVPDLSQEVSENVERLDGDIKNLSENTIDIIAEAALEAATGVDNEGYTRRKATAEIKLEQKTMVTDLGAQAEQILTITASVDDNKAAIQENKLAVVKLDEDTKQVIESITQRLDTQQSNIGSNTAKITTNEQTIVKIDGDLNTAKGSITSITSRLEKQESDIAGNKASITSNNQTIVTQGGEISKNIKDIANLTDSTNTAISALTSRVDSQKSEIDGNKASINSQSQTLVVIGKKADDNEKAIDGVTTSITSLTDVVTSQKSEIDSNKATIGTQATTIVQQGGKIDKAILDISKLDADTKNSLSSLTIKVNSQGSEIDNNKASITSQSQTLVVMGQKVDKNSSDLGDVNNSITAISNTLQTQKSAIDANTSSITNQSQTIVTVEGIAKGAQTTANTARIEAGSASNAAAVAAGIADGKGKVMIQSNAPLAADRLAQNLWIDTTGNANTPKKWDGTSWVAVTDKAAVNAANAAAAAKAAADKAQADANANAAKITSMSGTLTKLESDINSNKASIVDQAQTIVTIENKADNAQSSASEAVNKANAAQSDADKAKEDAKNAAGIAAGKGKVLIQPMPPSSFDSLEQNLWIDTSSNSNTPKRWTGSNWVAVTDKAAVDAAAAAAAAQAAADKAQSDANENAAKITVVSETLKSLESQVGQNKASITDQSQTIVTVTNTANAAANKADNADSTASAANAAAIRAAEVANGKGKVLIQSTIPSSVDRLPQNLWIDTRSGANTPRRWTGSSWQPVTDKAAINAKNAATAAQGTANTAVGKANTNAQNISVMSQRLTTVESKANDTAAKVTQNTQTIATINADGSSAYKAQWGVKASIGDITAGIGLTVKRETGKPDVSQCTIIADQFSVGRKGSNATIYPFIVTSAGVFIDTAYIKAANIQDLVAGAVVADTIKASATITAPKIKGGTITIGSNFNVDANGNVTGSNVNFKSGTFAGTVNAKAGVFNNVTINENCDVKGTIYADKIVGDVVSAITKPVTTRTQGSVGLSPAAISGTVRYARAYSRTLVVGGLYLQLNGRSLGSDSRIEARLKLNFTGVSPVYTNSIELTTKGVSSAQSSEVTVPIDNLAITVPAQRTGSYSVQVEVIFRGRSGSNAVISSVAPVPVFLYRNGNGLS